MNQIIYSLEFLSDWHCSSGLSGGADADLLALKDERGLPYVPGKTIKGLLREAAEILRDFSADQQLWSQFLRRDFGEQTDKHSDQSQSGGCYFSNAELTATVKQEITSHQARLLYRQIAATAIEAGDSGQAQEKSLRKIEVVVPLTLFGEIDNCSDCRCMEQCLKLIKRLGSNRNRGLGRCNLKIKEVR